MELDTNWLKIPRPDLSMPIIWSNEGGWWELARWIFLLKKTGRSDSAIIPIVKKITILPIVLADNNFEDFEAFICTIFQYRRRGSIKYWKKSRTRFAKQTKITKTIPKTPKTPINLQFFNPFFFFYERKISKVRPESSSLQIKDN